MKIPVHKYKKVVACAQVDEDDYDFLKQIYWFIDKDGYAVGSVNGKTSSMQRLVNQTPKGLMTDHINRNKLDNRKSNLRSVTNRENQLNRNRSTLKNAHANIYKAGKYYKVRVMKNNKRYTENHKTLRDAIVARDAMVARLYNSHS